MHVHAIGDSNPPNTLLKQEGLQLAEASFRDLLSLSICMLEWVPRCPKPARAKQCTTHDLQKPSISCLMIKWAKWEDSWECLIEALPCSIGTTLSGQVALELPSLHLSLAPSPRPTNAKSKQSIYDFYLRHSQKMLLIWCFCLATWLRPPEQSANWSLVMSCLCVCSVVCVCGMIEVAVAHLCRPAKHFRNLKEPMPQRPTFKKTYCPSCRWLWVNRNMLPEIPQQQPWLELQLAEHRPLQGCPS